MAMSTFARLVVVVLGVAYTSPCRAENEGRAAPSRSSPGIEISPAVRHSFTTSSISENAVALDLGIAPTRRLVMGVSGAVYIDGTYDRSPNAGPLTQKLASVLLDVKGIVFEGSSFAVYLRSGPGVVYERPVSLVDPAVRSFAYDPAIAFSVGAGARLSLAEHIALLLELSDTAYLSQYENGIVAPSDAYRRSSDTWFGEKHLVAAPEVRVGISFLLGSHE